MLGHPREGHNPSEFEHVSNGSSPSTTGIAAVARATPPHDRMLITSRKNPLVMRYRQALAGKLAGWFVVEGPRLLLEAMEAGLRLDSVLVTEGAPGTTPWRERLAADVPVHEVNESVLRATTETPSPQGVVGLAEVPTPSDEQLFRPAGASLLVVAAGVQNPGNLGSLVRSTEAFAGSGVIALAGSAQPFRPAVIRGAMGSLFRLPVVHGWSIERLERELGAHAVPTVALVPRGGTPLDEAPLEGSLALVLGSEAHGIPEPLLERCSRRVSIPQSTAVESLSVSHAAAIALYEIQRRRRKGGES